MNMIPMGMQPIGPQPPMKVQVARGFIQQMRWVPETDCSLPPSPDPMTPPELSAYNAAHQVMYLWFTGEMEYEDPMPPSPPEPVVGTSDEFCQGYQAGMNDACTGALDPDLDYGEDGDDFEDSTF